MSVSYEKRAAEGLERLGLAVARDHLDGAAQRAVAEGWSYTHFLGYLLEGELSERHRRCVALNLKVARFPVAKRIDDFDFAPQPGLDRRMIEELATARFLYEGRNVVLLGPPGVGKTHLAIGLGVMTAERGHRVYFTTAVDLATKLTKARAANRLHRALNALMQPKPRVVDDVGYLSLEATQASLLFQVICQCYQREQAIVLTSNKPFGEWAHVFAGDSVIASAALDRLLHRGTVINIRGESYRLINRRKSGKSRNEEERG